ncbi:hypothetical protein [Paraburkholderia sp. BCC1886]|uniref:hypothetical protein n=1 Tax=Paraburkholderia sp. BCC1886 TaxID=2562670 RepID=UPI001181D690|nr:hypothetical protein [Paraburkholderia sp. BCC1886]
MDRQIANSAADSSTPAPALTLSSWESVTRQAIAAGHDAQHQLALAGYRQALSIARRLLAAPPAGRAEDCVAALVVSSLNLADLQVEQGDIDDAAALLGGAHEALLDVFLNAARDTSLRQAALRHSRETHVALIAHVARHGDHPLITRALRAGCVAVGVDRPTQH